MKNCILGGSMFVLTLGASFTADAQTQQNAPVKQEVAGQQNTQLTDWQKGLLGEQSDLNKLNASNIRQTYITFMENVRNQHSNWTDQQWEEAKAVLQQLDNRKEPFENRLGADDKAKIKMLQAEFRTLETKGDVKD